MPIVGIFILDGTLLPVIFYLLIKRSKTLSDIPLSRFMKIYVFGIAIFPILLPRKHIEYWLAMRNPSFLFILLVIQMINNLFEEFGKFITLYVGTDHRTTMDYLTSLTLGLFSGMAYGIGEAYTLSIISMWPTLMKIFKVNLTLLFITWTWVLERFFAILIHTIMGGFVGVSFYYLKKSEHLKAFLFFFLAILYHELVDGLLIFATFHQTSPVSIFLMKHIYDVTLPLLLMIGLFGIFILFKKKEVEP